MPPDFNDGLSRRERQIMDALYRLGRASAAEVRDAIPNPPTYTAVRTHLTLLQEKGLIRFEKDANRYIYEPVIPREHMAREVIQGVVTNFFGGSIESVVSTLLDSEETSISDDQLARLQSMIEDARRKGK